ncbi:class I SAM-dependent methyltransferase [Candidatus Woesearchaeota archaeon]|nr:class I SAM-dependent methyltransferase [Candidatus Woesearchaeota archaeon]
MYNPQIIRLPCRIPEPKDRRIDAAYLEEAISQGPSSAVSQVAEYFFGLLAKSFGTIPKSSLILDVACGTGETSAKIAKIAPHLKVVGIDLNEEAISYAQRHHREIGLGNLEFRVGDVYDIGDLQSKASGVVVWNSLHHFDHLERAVRQIYKTLTRQGFFLFVDLNRELVFELPHDMKLPTGEKVQVGSGMYRLRAQFSDAETVDMAFGGQLFEEKPPENIIRFLEIISVMASYTPDELVKILEKIGFNEHRIVRYDFWANYFGIAKK